MKNKKEIKVTVCGKLQLSSLTESERKIFYSTLLNRIKELYKKSLNDCLACACLDTSKATIL